MALLKLHLPTGIEFTYYDTGAPSQSHLSYRTLFAVHGFSFNGLIWKPMFPFVEGQNIRLVVINRRGYGSSSAVTSEEKLVADTDPAQYVNDRGKEILSFINLFVKREAIPIKSDDTGFGMVGWSMGATWNLAALSQLDSDDISDEIRSTFKQGFRGLILHDVNSQGVGWTPEKTWFWPFSLPQVPASETFPFSLLWMTGYFDHPNISNPTPDTLIEAAPSLNRVPTIFNIQEPQRSEVFLQENGVSTDTTIFYSLPAESTRANFEKICINTSTSMASGVVLGEKTIADTLYTSWKIGETTKLPAHVIPGANHFSPWDLPKETLEGYLEILKRLKQVK